MTARETLIGWLVGLILAAGIVLVARLEGGAL